jgi:Leucine-rich repeat (LRR) protein
MEFKLRDYKKGFWSYRPDENFPPEGISNPKEYLDQEKLNIFDESDCTPYEQTKLNKQWIEELPNLEKVKTLWVSKKVSQAMFEAICEMKNLEALWIKWSGIKSLNSLLKLKNLQSLHIGSSTKIESIDPIEEMTQLKWLELENIKQIDDLTPIGKCTQLVGLAVTGSMYSTQKVKSLSPLAHLSDLRFLDIANLKSQDKSLKSLFNLSKLITFDSAQWWSESELRELKK